MRATFAVVSIAFLTVSFVCLAFDALQYATLAVALACYYELLAMQRIGK